MAIHTSKFNFYGLPRPQSSQRQMATQVFAKLTVASKKSSQIKPKTLFYSSNKKAIYVIITSKFASIKFQQCCVRKLKTKSLHLKFSSIARGSLNLMFANSLRLKFTSSPLNLVALRGKAQTHFLQIRYISTWHFAFCSEIIPDDNGTCAPFKDFILPTS